MTTTFDHDDSSQSIVQITTEDFDLIQQSAVKFGGILAKVVAKLNNKGIKSIFNDLPILRDSLYVIVEIAGKNYCHYIQQKSRKKQDNYTNKKIIKAKLLIACLGLSDRILDTSDTDLFNLIKVGMSEKMEKVALSKGVPQLEDKNWSFGTFKILTGYDKSFIKALSKANSHEDILAKKIIEQSRLFTEDNRYSYVEDSCMKYITAFMPYAKSLETEFYTIGNERNQLIILKRSYPHLPTDKKLGTICSAFGLSPVPREKLLNNLLDIHQSDRAKANDCSYVNDYNI